MSRQEMIDTLIKHEMEVNYSDLSYVREVLMTGLRGFNDYTDDELKAACDEVSEFHDRCFN